jgi:2-octaprenyl-3-methyl-6-methoxy-1,4-benzoquinol hydroxylase/2-octaprenylphenol hydroxylase
VTDRRTGRRYDVAVIGAGIVGSAAACLLARSGLSVAVVEGREPEPFDAAAPVGLRVSAFSPGSEAILSEAGSWRQVSRQRHCPYRTMRIEDRDESTTLEFNAAEFGLDRLGTIVENNLVQWSLWQSLLAAGGVELLCPETVSGLDERNGVPLLTLESGQSLQCGLVVAADGADSVVRGLVGIEQDQWEYGQSGLVSVIRTETPNPGTAWQRFLADGPLAFLPLADGSSSIVWSLPEAEAARLLSLDDAAFLSELQAAVAGSESHWPDQPLSCGPRAAFPLSMRLSRQYVSAKCVLIGDAAHVVHPLAGQGVNLGLLDAAGLVEILLESRGADSDFPEDRALEKFGRWRRSEAEVMARGMHSIRGLFMPDELGLLRRLGIGLLDRSWTAKELFVKRATGRHFNAPALARGVALTELLRR